MRIIDIYYYLGGSRDTWFHKQKRAYLLYKKKRLLKKYGLTILEKYHQACAECGIDGWLEFGTLLGAYREKSFIAHDFDLDVGMYDVDYTSAFEGSLNRHGFKKVHSFYLQNLESNIKTLSEVTFSYKNFCIDIFLSRKEKDSRVVYTFVIDGSFSIEKPAVNKYELLPAQPNETVFIDGHTFNAPSRVKDQLSLIYGKNFMVPDPNWRTASDSNKFVKRMNYDKFYGIWEEE